MSRYSLIHRSVRLSSHGSPAQSGGKYPNSFWRGPDGLLRVSWFGEPNEKVDGPSLRRIVAAQFETGDGSDDSGGPAAASPVLLFCRVRQGPYVFAGRVMCERVEPPAAPGGCATAALVLADSGALDGSAAFGAVLQASGGYAEEAPAWVAAAEEGAAAAAAAAGLVGEVTAVAAEAELAAASSVASIGGAGGAAVSAGSRVYMRGEP